MTVRYLYGKRNILLPVISDKAGLRLSDLTHYSRMENEMMRDNEMEKQFVLDRERFSLLINDRIVDNREMTADPIITLIPRHCFCICLSKRRNEPELYQKFKADICIGFDVELLRERLEVISGKLPGVKFIGKDVFYYDPRTLPGTFTHDELVFCKPSTFIHESEYRLAMFYPEDKSGFKTDTGTVPFRKEGESMHLTFSHCEKGYISDCVTDIFYSDSRTKLE